MKNKVNIKELVAQYLKRIKYPGDISIQFQYIGRDLLKEYGIEIVQKVQRLFMKEVEVRHLYWGIDEHADDYENNGVRTPQGLIEYLLVINQWVSVECAVSVLNTIIMHRGIANREALMGYVQAGGREYPEWLIRYLELICGMGGRFEISIVTLGLVSFSARDSWSGRLENYTSNELLVMQRPYLIKQPPGIREVYERGRLSYRYSSDPGIRPIHAGCLVAVELASIKYNSGNGKEYVSVHIIKEAYK